MQNISLQVVRKCHARIFQHSSVQQQTVWERKAGATSDSFAALTLECEDFGKTGLLSGGIITYFFQHVET